MRLYIKQRVFSWTDTYDVYDEYENAKYFVKAEFLSIGHNIHVYEKSTGREIGAIHQKLLSFLPAFEVEIGGCHIGTIQKKFSLFRSDYEIDYNNWYVQGNFLGWDYDVMNGCSSAIHISKEPFHWGDTYVLDFVNPADEIMGLMLVIAIDAANCNGKN